MSYYSVITVTLSLTEWIHGYLGPEAEPVPKHGGKYLARTASH
jgi:uncharacterized protein (DUF1330 family)